MALYEAAITVMDDKSQKSVITLWLLGPDLIPEETADPADFLGAYAQILDTKITGAIVAISYRRQVALPVGIKSMPEANSDVEEGGVFTWLTTGRHTTRQRIPTWDETLTNSDGSIAAEDLGDLYGLTVEPIEEAGSWVLHPTDARGADIIALVEAKEQFVRSRR